MLINRKKRLLAGKDRKRFAVAVAFLLAAGFTALVNAAERKVEGLDFKEVVVWGDTEVKIFQGDQRGLRMRGGSRDLDKTPFFIDDDVLYLGHTEHGEKADDVRFKLAVTDLERLTLKGSGEVWVKPLKLGDLKVTLEGSGDMYLHGIEGDSLSVNVAGSGSVALAEADVAELDLVISGSGTMELGAIKANQMTASLNGSGDILASKDGKVTELAAHVVGSGDVELHKIRAEEVEVNVMGSGDATVWAAKKLNVSIMGSGDVAYKGDPQKETNVFGSGDIEQLD